MWSKVIFGHPKWPLAASLWKKKVEYWSEMARNVIESDLRSSKMAAGSHFVKKKVAYWSKMARNAIEGDFQSSNMPRSNFQNGRQQPFWKKNQKKKSCTSKMAAGSRFVKKKIKVAYWSEMRSKVIFGHPKWPLVAILKEKNLNEMARNAIESDFRSSKMAQTWLPKWPPATIFKKESCVWIWNGEKCDQKWFSVIQNGPNLTSKMAAGSHFEKKSKKNLCIDLKWREMYSKVIFGHPKWPLAAILKKKSKKKVAYWSEMARNAIESDFQSSKMAAGSHFVEKS